jgi:hypothetical protein
MKKNFGMIFATALFWVLGSYFIASAQLKGSVRMDDPFDEDRQIHSAPTPKAS